MCRLINYRHFFSDSVFPCKQLQLCNEFTGTTQVNSLSPGYFFMPFVVCQPFNFLKKSFRNTIRVSNSLNLDQAQHFAGPDLGPNCLQRLSADDIRRLVKIVLLSTQKHMLKL